MLFKRQVVEPSTTVALPELLLQTLENLDGDSLILAPGDVAFFTNDSGRVIHVGILLSKDKIIHASGRVKIDKLDNKGIWSEELNTYSHTLFKIKRLR